MPTTPARAEPIVDGSTIVDASDAQPLAALAPNDGLAAAVADRGALQGKPIAAGDGRFVVFVETPLRASMALLVSAARDGGAPAVEDLGLPTASRVVLATTWRGKVYVVVESIAALDQPGGLRVVQSLLLGEREQDYSLLQRTRLAEATDEEDLRKRLQALGPAPKEPPYATDQDMVLALRNLRRPSELAAMLSSEGVDVGVSYAASFLQRTVHLGSASLTAAAMKPLVLVGISVSSCSAAYCSSSDDDGGPVAIHFTRPKGGRATLIDVETSPPAVPIASPSAPSPVATSADTTALAQACKRLGKTGRMLASAPLRSDGSGVIGVVARDDGGEARLDMVFVDGAWEEALEMDLGLIDPATAKVGFVESDGDGRADVVVFGEASYMKKRSKAARLYLSPRDVGSPGRMAQAERSALFALRGTTSLEAALAAAITLPTGAIPKTEACPIVLALGDKRTAPAALAPGAKTYAYNEPTQPEVSLHKVGLDGVATGYPPTCSDLRCDARRPFCTYADPPSIDWFWLARDKGRLLSTAVVRYDGS